MFWFTDVDFGFVLTVVRVVDGFCLKEVLSIEADKHFDSTVECTGHWAGVPQGNVC